MDILIVALAVAGAAAYAGFKTWKMLKPGAPAGCGCSKAGSGCGGCPISPEALGRK